MIKSILISAWVPPGHEFVLTEGAPSDGDLFGVIPHSMGPDGELGPLNESGEIIPLPDEDVRWRELQAGEIPCGIQELPDSRGYVQKALLLSVRKVPVMPLGTILLEYQARQETSRLLLEALIDLAGGLDPAEPSQEETPSAEGA